MGGQETIMFGFSKKQPAPPALTNQDVKLYELEMRILVMEQAVVELCHHLKEHLDRIDHNIVMLDKNMHNLAAMTLRPPKNLLGGGQEPN
jgi:hypothetical protein